MLVIGVVSGVSSASPVQWTAADGGNGHWYEFIMVDQSRPQHDAQAQARGGHLVTITSQGEGNFVEAVRDAANAHAAFHTGGWQDPSSPDYAEPDGGWRWVTGEAFDYANWGFSDGADQPDNYNGEDRLGLRWQEDDVWCDVHDTTEWFAMVEWSADCNGDGIVDFGQILDGTLDDLDGNGVPDCCENGGTCSGTFGESVQWGQSAGGNGHWYVKVTFEEPAHVLDAQGFAEGIAGYVCTVRSHAENDWAWDTFENSTLGGYQDMDAPDYNEPNGGWRWANGEPWDYTNWLPGEPNNANGNEHCIAVCCPPNKQWNDVQYYNATYLLEFDADCNGDGIVDYGQILDGTFEDANGNGVPDCCDDGETCGCAADFNGDETVDLTDILIILAQWGSNGPLGDANQDGIVGVADLLVAIKMWGAC